MNAAIREKILRFIDDSAEDQLAFVVDLCEQNSYTFNKAGVDAVSRMILAALGGIFPVCKRIPQEERGAHFVLRTKESGKAI